MYTLRIISQEKGPNGKFGESITNFELGDHYSVYGKNTKEFEDMFEGATKEARHNAKHILVGENGIKYLISTNDNEDEIKLYFIMCDNGKTFERLNNG